MSDESSDDAEYRELMLKKLQAYGHNLYINLIIILNILKK